MTYVTARPEPIVEALRLGVSQKTVLLPNVTDVEQPSSVELTLGACVLPAEIRAGEKVFVASLRRNKAGAIMT